MQKIPLDRDPGQGANIFRESQISGRELVRVRIWAPNSSWARKTITLKLSLYFCIFDDFLMKIVANQELRWSSDPVSDLKFGPSWLKNVVTQHSDGISWATGVRRHTNNARKHVLRPFLIVLEAHKQCWITFSCLLLFFSLSHTKCRLYRVTYWNPLTY